MPYRNNQLAKKDSADLIAKRNLTKYHNSIQRAATTLVEEFKKEIEDSYTGEPLLLTRHMISKDAEHIIPIVKAWLPNFGWRAYSKICFQVKFLVVPNNETSNWRRVFNEIKYRFKLWLE